VARFSTPNGIIGTGCRSVANWFLVAAAPDPRNDEDDEEVSLFVDC
jgi:hypothetical protein